MGFARLGATVARRAWLILGLSLVGFLVAGAVGGNVAESLSAGGFSTPDAEATRAGEILEDEFDAGSPNLVLLVTPVNGASGLEAPGVAAAGLALTDELEAEPGVTDVVSYWSLGSPPPLAATDGSSALVLARIEGTQDEVSERVGDLQEAYTRDGATLGEPIDVAVGGEAAVFHQVGETIEADLRLAETIALPLTLLLLVLVFRSIVGALLPVLIGAFAIVGTFLVLEIVASITEVSIFALNLTTAMGLGLAIDYSLLVVNRFREERGNGLEPRAALVRTVMTAGRAVVFSGLTVAASLAALLVFPLSFLRSFAYAGIPVVLLAVFGAVVVLPALLALFGHRVGVSRGTTQETDDNFWARIARFVMRRPVPVAAVAVAFLLVLGAPFLRIAFGFPDDRVLPEDASTRQVSEVLRRDFSANEARATTVVLHDEGATLSADAVAAYATELSTLDGVARVDSETGVYLAGVQVLDRSPVEGRFVGDTGQWLSVVPSVEPMSAEGEALVEAVRAADPGLGGEVEVLVGGPSADLLDTKAALLDKLPLALAIVGGVIFVLLFLSFGSVLVPVKALVLNLLSLTATFGAMVWIFQDGNLSGFLGFTPTGLLDTTTPILMFCVAFGLSMDYEVFLLSRIKEEYDHTGDNTHSVAVGLARTGRIVTAAAALISVVFLAFATSGIAFIKLFGIGLTLAVVMDATVVRAFLVPAFMRLAGEANWWAPRWMRAIYDRVGFSESAAEAAASAAVLDLRDDDGAPASAPREPAGTGAPR
jgi:RND superfamily putative drug exporter